MKTLHIHIKTGNLDQTVAYYAAMFDTPPTKLEADYAQWRLDDPRANISISTRRGDAGIDHTGLSFESGDEMEATAARLRDLETAPEPEKDATCCYARSDKYWSSDPQGVTWELFHTFGDSETYGAERKSAPVPDGACCVSAS